MKRFIPVLFSFVAFLFLLSFTLLAQNPDAWEEYQTSLQPPETVIPAIDLKEGMMVGEIGAGRGRYAVILAKHVGEKGYIYANDINREDLEYLDFRCERDKIDNINTILGKEKDPLLPENRLDMIFIVNSYHHFSHPTELLKNAYPALKKSGTLVIIEGVPNRYGGYSSHTTSKEDVISRTEEAGFRFDRVAAELKKDNIYVFTK
ncbi:MAG: class I SAM-dependent methyltransferase [Bacteroidota bacterium]|nr:class I SAM-dependent methyltransferase [Bacteroidota bacterium]